MAVSRHLRDDAIEFARLQSRFEETYLLVEVGVKLHGLKKQDPPAISTAAFALVPLVDEEALFNLFTTQSTSVQFVDRDGSSERLPPADYRVVRISMLDVGLDRVMKLGEGYFLSESYGGEDPFDSYHSTSSRKLTPSFEEVTETGPRKQVCSDRHVVTGNIRLPGV